ncbi:ABC transporter ATP-binding protein [Paraburkholderia xenovorans]|uniref:ABC transporter ATP-binding protein n=1 Tax=Paraburkholderia xenovorans TaxID=36873 RepID=UPI001C12DE2F|nr:ABC transporter ATP-binding protein [Paraburkholderia xenovorans]
MTVRHDAPSKTPVLQVQGLSIAETQTGRRLVQDIGFALQRGQSLGIVGESGSGKSLTCKAILGILPENLSVAAGRIEFDGFDVTRFDHEAWRPLRAVRIAAVFQDPGSYLNPSITVGKQLAQVLRDRADVPADDVKEHALALFERVGLRDPARVYAQYPYELSGGMLQRIVIAIAVAAHPILLIADEATTALDVTVQAEVLDLLADLREQYALSLIFVTHDLAVVAQISDHLLVMRDGEIVESGPTQHVLQAPRHVYTKLLIQDHLEYGLDKFVGERE